MLTDEEIENLDDFNLWELSRHLIIHSIGKIIEIKSTTTDPQEVAKLNNKLERLRIDRNNMKDADVRRKIIKEVVKNGL